MRRILLMALLAFACGPASPRADEEPGITRACIRSFAPTLDAWEAAFDRVPVECAYLDAVYTVDVVAAGDLPCSPANDAERVAGCTQPAQRLITLLHGRSDSELVDSSVHEWVHALAFCVDGDADQEHLRAGLWARYGDEAVEAQAHYFGVEIGSCL